ncbi:MAG TPA: hypothetical protein VFG07_09305 [Thermoplasmata archaeon]|nr:hypothetical protein [Thermoplasmata archaeon]
MRQLGFDQLTPYAFPGGVVQGQVVVETDQPARGRDLTIQLVGRELSQATVSSGKSSQRIVDESVFYQQTYDLRQSVSFIDQDHLAPGTYRAPFQFVLPPTATPSLATSRFSGESGLFSARPDGMYVEYALEARLDVPWWIDAVARAPVPVYSQRRVLGQIPVLESRSNPGHAALRLQPDSASPLLPGSPYSLVYQVWNPASKHLKSLDLSVVRQVEYHVKSMSRAAHEPAFSSQVPLDGRNSQYTGGITLEVPNVPDATGPWQGTLFRSYWLATAVLEVELGFNVQVQAPLTPA